MDYNVTVEIDDAPTPARVNHWIDYAVEYSPVVSRTDWGTTEIIITVPATDLLQAVRTALGLFREATTVQAMPTATFDQRNGIDPIPELVGATEAAKLLGVSRQRVAQMVQEGELPAGRELVGDPAGSAAHPRDRLGAVASMLPGELAAIHHEPPVELRIAASHTGRLVRGNREDRSPGELAPAHSAGRH